MVEFEASVSEQFEEEATVEVTPLKIAEDYVILKVDSYGMSKRVKVQLNETAEVDCSVLAYFEGQTTVNIEPPCGNEGYI